MAVVKSSRREPDDSRLIDTLGIRKGTNTGTGSIKVLHVDDEPDFGELVSVYLEREGDIDVVTETSAEAGLERLEAETIDCVVSDYDMPGKDGLEFLEEVRETYPSLPFILFTGKGSEEIASDAISSGVTDYLQKKGGKEQYKVLANRVENVTRRYHAEKEMSRGLRAIETAREGISFLDNDGRFVYVNHAYADIYGYDREELVGKHWEMLYPDDDVEMVYDEILPTVPEEGRWTGESVHLRKDGTRLVVDHALAYTDEDTLVCLVRDISEEKESQRKRESKRKKDAVDAHLKERAMDEAPIGITISGPPEDDVPLIYANEGFQRLTGYQEDEILGRNCRFLQGDATEEEPVQKMREAIKAGENISVELRNYRKDGTEFWNRVTISPITDDDAEETNFVGFQEDISERKRKERQLERQLKQFERFSSVLLHDVGTPLSVAKGRLQMAREATEDENLEKADEALDRVDRIVEGLSNVMREGELVTETTDISLKEAARNVWGTVSSGNENATLGVVDARLRADENALARLLENLLRNAVEHGSTGSQQGADDAVEHGSRGSRTESDDTVENGSQSEDDETGVHVQVGVLPDGFYVEDDGPGVPPDKRDDVFGFGYSAKDDRGHGVGLASVRQIAVAHGWEVKVTEGDMGGARFEVRDVEKVR